MSLVFDDIIRSAIPVPEAPELRADRGAASIASIESEREAETFMPFQPGVLQNMVEEPIRPSFRNGLFELGLTDLAQDVAGGKSIMYLARITDSDTTAEDWIFTYELEQVRREAGTLNYETVVGGFVTETARNVSEGSTDDPPVSPQGVPVPEGTIVLVLRVELPSGQTRDYFQYSTRLDVFGNITASSAIGGANNRWSYSVRVRTDTDANGEYITNGPLLTGVLSENELENTATHINGGQPLTLSTGAKLTCLPLADNTSVTMRRRGDHWYIIGRNNPTDADCGEEE